LIEGQRDRIDPASIKQNLNTIKSAQNLLAIFGVLIDRYVAITSITGRNRPRARRFSEEKFQGCARISSESIGIR
jgi:hypothetical protein